MTLTLSIIIWWILIGLVVGGVARLVIPGRQHIGIILTILIGIVAAIARRDHRRPRCSAPGIP